MNEHSLWNSNRSVDRQWLPDYDGQEKVTELVVTLKRTSEFVNFTPQHEGKWKCCVNFTVDTPTHAEVCPTKNPKDNGYSINGHVKHRWLKSNTKSVSDEMVFWQIQSTRTSHSWLGGPPVAAALT
ncbi:hypothetical protein RUM43_002259 [Polyplax serrata]|uniref:Uncharacterized protein n=1 Tax=Polyplax serrata TaxID=468196 RepID=A0AAN8S2K2_POLSC